MNPLRENAACALRLPPVRRRYHLSWSNSRPKSESLLGISRTVRYGRRSYKPPTPIHGASPAGFLGRLGCRSGRRRHIDMYGLGSLPQTAQYPWPAGRVADAEGSCGAHHRRAWGLVGLTIRCDTRANRPYRNCVGVTLIVRLAGQCRRAAAPRKVARANEKRLDQAIETMQRPCGVSAVVARPTCVVADLGQSANQLPAVPARPEPE